MAADEVVRWSTVVGEYAVLLTEMGSMEDLSTPIKAYPRIKYTCMTVSRKYVAMGSSTGGLYVFDRKTLHHPRFISNKDGPVHAVCFAQHRSLLAVATSVGIVLIWEVSTRHREKPKLIRRSEEHKNSTVTALCWDDEEGRLFAGDSKGVVSVVHVPPANKSSYSVNKSLPLLHNSSIVAKAHTGIVQLDCAGDKLLVSTMSKSAVVDLKSLDCVPVGVKLRDGFFGSCFLKESISDNPTIYSARPGSRLWEASTDGQVMSTQQYKKSLATPPVTILGHGRSAAEPVAEGDFPPQSVNFAKLLLVRERFIVTWLGTSLYIIDPVLGRLVAWYSLDTEILDICCFGAEIYVYHVDGCVKWFGLLSVKECVSKLYEMGEIKQCLEVLLDCRHYIIPGSARDMVPISMVTNLRESFVEENSEEDQDVIYELQELEREMELPTEVSDNPPTYLGNLGLIDSPDTLSTCSDAVSDDIDVLSAGSRELDERSDDGVMGKAGLHNKLKKKWSADLSLEGMLLSAAAAAKRFTAERQLGINKLKRTQSPDTSATGDLVAEPSIERNQEAGSPQRKLSFESEASQVAEGMNGKETVAEEESPRLQKKMPEQSPCHSDDSESRQSGNEGGVVEEESFEKKEKLTAKDKRKKKKSRVVTVDIDSPQLKQELFLDTPATRSPSFLRTHSSTGEVETSSRRLSEPVSPLQTELSPAIPSILSKAKGLLIKKLKPSSEDQSPSPSSSLSPITPSDENAVLYTEEEVEEIKLPKEVAELIECSSKARCDVKNPVVLFSVTSLCRVLGEWIPKLHEAMKSCLEMTERDDSGSNDNGLKRFLSATAFEDVSYLAQMCFDCGVYGSEGLRSFEDDVRSKGTTTKTPLCDFPVEQDKSETNDVVILFCDDTNKPESNRESDKLASESIPTSHGDVRATTSSEGHLPSAGTNPSSLRTGEFSPPSIRISVVKDENFDAETVDEESGENTLDTLGESANRQTDKPLNRMLGDLNNSPQSSADETVSSPTEMSKNAILSQDSSSGLQSLQSCERICVQCENGTTFFENNGKQVYDTNFNDETRSRFLSYHFWLMDVRRLRRALLMSKGERKKTWSTFMDCLSGLVSPHDVIAKYIKEGDARRALHELHDGMDKYCDVLLFHLTCLYENDSRETMLTCARMFPDVQPWEVMEICRHCKLHSLESTSADFVFYVEQLMRWRTEVGNTRQQTVRKLCEDMRVTNWWFHCSLIADSTKEALHCQQCGKPRPGSHTITWQNEDHLQQLIDFLCQKDSSELKVFMDLCWNHGYWSGLIRLCVRTGLRQEALKLVVSLSDMKLIKNPQSWGLLPKSLDEWKYLLELLLSRDQDNEVSFSTAHTCTTLAASDWLADLTWSNVTSLMLERLGAGHTVNILQALPQETPLLSTDFYYSCLLGAVVERRQRTLIHELLKKLDSYLWSQRSGALAPKLNSFRKEEEIWGPKSKENIKPQLDSFSQFRTLEDGASNWGQNIRLSDGECLVCSLKLCEQISTSNQGLLMFECGHVFHKHCVPEVACVVCFHQNLKSLGSCVRFQDSKVE